MNLVRVVLDTNVVVSAALNPEGLEARVVELVIAGKVDLFVSAAIVAEYAAVFARPKFARLAPAQIELLLRLLREEATMISPRQVVKASKDAEDNRFLECAEEAGAQYLVTGNLRHFPNVWKSTRIVNAREFLRTLIGGPSCIAGNLRAEFAAKLFR